MYIYQGKIINKPLYIHFLCGNKYKKKSTKDKRNVLKNYIDKKENNYALILESLFEPKEYKEMGFKDLEDVELMASHYAKSIIILHETVSTAAEIALFGSKKELKNKILVIFAPRENVVLDTVGNFLKLAYFNNDKIKNKSYFFETKVHTIKQLGIGYYNTFFQYDVLDQELTNEIENFWSNIKELFDIELKKKMAKVNFQNNYEIKENKINVVLSYNFILSFVICTLINNKFIRDKREKELCVKSICEFLKNVIKSTIEKREVVNLSEYKIYVKTPDDKEINLPIRFCIYLLDKIGFISFKDDTLQVSHIFKRQFEEYKDLIVVEDTPNFFTSEGDSKC